MSKKWYDNKRIIITGASSGFGKLLAEKLVKEHNCKVIGIARTESKLQALKEELGDNFSYFPFDVSNKEKWQELYSYLEQNNLQIDMLINNAGILPPFLSFEKYDESEYKKILEINFFASLYSTKTLFSLLKKSPYRSIINISSSAALSTVAGTSLYSASKSALKSFTESFMLEHKDFYVSIVCPGFAKTEIFRSQKQLDKKESSLISLVCSDPNKIVNKLLKKIARKRRRIVLGLDAHLMDFFTRMFPRTTPRLIRYVLKKSKVSLFNDI
ncbi:MAG: SDR family NAD(P)-dependent oxidoreductase [Clostridia bacterium]|nr:SDR family NAD(P)-dependent oxidoreductase [Clostridia bacterium]